MAKKGSLSLVEQHLEKGILGLAVAFMVALAVYFLILEPSTVDYGGQPIGPSELDEAILRDAEALQQAVDRKRRDVPEVPAYSRQLEQRFRAGTLGAPQDGGPRVPANVEVAAVFGQPLPSLPTTPDEDIVLVKPLPPTAPVLRTGISLVNHRPTYGTGAPRGGATFGTMTDEGEVKELSWVTLGAWFPAGAQRNEMTKAGYAPYRAKVYVVGMDVQRQEVTASGEYTEWMDVPPSKAVRRVEAPMPVYDDRTGDVLNQDLVSQTLEEIKLAQVDLMEPAFYEVEAGDEWMMPPLEGLGANVEEIEGQPVEPPPPLPKGTEGGEQRGGGGGFRPGGGGGGGDGADAKKEARDDLRDAIRAKRNKDWSEAKRAAKRVLDNAAASRSQRRQAQKIIREAERATKPQKPQGTTPGATFGGTQNLTQQREQLVRNPENEQQPAVWFHDDAVQPGKTYRYRMRVNLWNRYVGRRSSLRNPEQADQPVLVGEWSLPSAPITVAPKRHFFVTGPSFGEPAARVDVFTWHKGNWLRENFIVRAGEVIGEVKDVKAGKINEDGRAVREPVDFTTDALVLDVRIDEPVLYRRAAGKHGEFAYRETEALVLVYLDPADGQVKERISDVDRADSKYKELKEEWDLFKGSL